MTRIAPLLLLIALGIAAEGDPAIVPAPAAEPAAEAQPAPAPAAAEPAPAMAEPAPVAPEPAPVEAAPEPAPVEPAPEPAPVVTPPVVAPAAPASRRAGVRVARVADAAPIWDGRVRLGAGWDSNALLDSDPDTVQSATADYNGEAAIGWRPVANESDYIKATGSVSYDRRPQLDELDTTRLALGVSGAHQGDSLTMGGSLSTARYWLDGDGAAAELRGGASLAWLRSTSADLIAIEAAAIHFDLATDRPQGANGLLELGDADDRSGVLLALAYRHWWQLGDGNRIEAGIRGGDYLAGSDIETYALIQPWVAARWRQKAWEVQAKASIERRAYDGEPTPGEDSETATIGTITASADYRLAGGCWAGVYGGAGKRASSVDDRDYDRWQAGLRFTYTFAAEE